MRREKMLIRSAMTALVLSALFVLGASAASIGRGTVTAGPLRLRAEPTTSSSILATAPSNADVVVLGEASDNWYKVEFTPSPATCSVTT
ncbi:MAG: SH3 domain-containing protein [Clostridiales bacterium]|nr:SH3 domain-containing protein [Clostridiales bacterium]